jgi:hypothetical protein
MGSTHYRPSVRVASVFSSNLARRMQAINRGSNAVVATE